MLGKSARKQLPSWQVLAAWLLESLSEAGEPNTAVRIMATKLLTKVLGSVLLSTGLLALDLNAQAGQLVRGDVDGVRGTRRFQLKCTTVPLISRNVNLQALHDASRQKKIEYEMRVRNVGSAARPMLDVLSARVIPELFDMGNIRLGRSDRWHVLGNPGDAAFVFLTGQSLTGYLPLGAAGSWNLGANFVFFKQGIVSVLGRFEFRFQPPNLRSLVGKEIAGQALTVTPAGKLTITNPQCKTVRSK